MPQTKDEIQFAESVQFDHGYVRLVDCLKHEEVRLIANSYKSNMDRVTSLPSMAICLAVWASRPEALEFYAHSYKFEKGDRLKFLVGSTIVNTWVKESQKLLDGDSVAALGVQSVLAAMILDSYTAFEALAGDLWTCAVNMDPEKFLGPKAIYYRSKLEKKGTNPIGRFGDQVRESNSVRLQSLVNIRKAYEETIGATYLQHPGLTVMSSVRNLLVHQGGVVDLKFKANCERHDFAEMPVGERLTFTGPIVKELINPCVQIAGEMLKIVDDWAIKTGIR